MAGKGTVKFDTQSLSEIVVFAHQYRKAISDACDQLIAECNSISEKDYMNGGDGEKFKAAFQNIAQSCANMQGSVEHIIKTLNETLQKAIDATKGTFSNGAEESTEKTKAQAGVLKKE